METLIGLLVVHGIGNQKEGVLVEKVASSLDSHSTHLKIYQWLLNLLNRIIPQRSKRLKCTEPKKIDLNGIPLLVHEANWAIVSHPDNPPNIHYNPAIPKESFKTVISIWHRAGHSFADFFFFISIGASMLVYFIILVILEYTLKAVGWILISPFRKVGKWFSKYPPKFIYRWIYRLGWIMVAMPVLGIIQTVKASGNFLSILLTEKGFITRLKVFIGIHLVIIALLPLLFICYILILPLLVLLLPNENIPFIILPIVYIVVFLIEWLALPAIDLMLDVANYHVLTLTERKDYFKRIDDGIKTLHDAGCTEIHILAHSLGSIIIYDWLHARRSESHHITVLHTIGSPLNKFWYVDHTQERRLEDKQGLENLVSTAWINYWAYSDPVSGKLNHYNAPNLKVNNKRIHWLGGFVLSHARYWKNKVVLDNIRECIVKNYAQLQKSM